MNDIVKFSMEKWHKYWRRFPVREKISVEEADLHVALRRPEGRNMYRKILRT